MKLGSFEKMDGEVEADETFVGGIAKNMHPHCREEAITGTGGAGKTAVMGIPQRSRGKNQSSFAPPSFRTLRSTLTARSRRR